MPLFYYFDIVCSFHKTLGTFTRDSSMVSQCWPEQDFLVYNKKIHVFIMYLQTMSGQTISGDKSYFWPHIWKSILIKMEDWFLLRMSSSPLYRVQIYPTPLSVATVAAIYVLSWRHILQQVKYLKNCSIFVYFLVFIYKGQLIFEIRGHGGHVCSLH